MTLFHLPQAYHAMPGFARTCVCFVLVPWLGLTALHTSASAQTAFEATTRGAVCRQNSQGAKLCTYRVGRDLELSITGVGEINAGTSFRRSSIDGDFFARVSLQHPCIIITAGFRAPAEARTSVGEYAFISPRTGLVYRTWPECARAR